MQIGSVASRLLYFPEISAVIYSGRKRAGTDCEELMLLQAESDTFVGFFPPLSVPPSL